MFAIICNILGIRKTCTTSLNPQSNGLVERLNRTLAEQVAVLTSKHQHDWDSHLLLVLMVCHSAVQESILYPSSPDVGARDQHLTCNGLWPSA